MTGILRDARLSGRFRADRFGETMAVDAAGRTLPVGMTGFDNGRDPEPGSGDTDAILNSGAVKLHDLSGAAPVPVATLEHTVAVMANDRIGLQVDLSADGARAFVASSIRGDGTPSPRPEVPQQPHAGGAVTVRDLAGAGPRSCGR